MKASLTSILFSAVLLTACHSNSYKLTGDVKGLEDGDTLFLTHDLETGTPHDTLIVKDGRFSLSGEADSTSLWMIYSAKRNEINAPFFIEPGTISIHLTEEPGASRVSGTLCNDQWQELMEKIDRLNKRFANMIIKRTEKNIDNEFGYFLLTYYPEELIDNEQRTRLIEKLPAEMRQRPAIQHMQQTLATAAKTAEGSTITDFTQQAPDGTKVSLMDEVKKNKVTVIDFWASWCGPCRQEMPFMIELYKQYQSQGLGIIGISLDNERDAWLNATEAMGITWPQMSDLKGWENEIALYFNVTSIPHTIVVDQQGKILRRGLRGETLQQYIQSLVQK